MLIQMVSGSGTTEPSNQMLAPPGRIPATRTALAASLGIEKTPTCQINSGPTRFSKSSASLKDHRARRLQRARQELRRRRDCARRPDRPCNLRHYVNLRFAVAGCECLYDSHKNIRPTTGMIMSIGRTSPALPGEKLCATIIW